MKAHRTGTPENNLLCFAHIKYHFVFDGQVRYVFEFIDNVYVSVFRDKEDNIISVLVSQISNRQTL